MAHTAQFFLRSFFIVCLRHTAFSPSRLQFNFAPVGITGEDPSISNECSRLRNEGYAIDRTRVQVGSGRNTYRQACDAILNWRHFNLDWAYTNAPAIKRNAGVVVCARSLFLWSLNPLRITDVQPDGRPSSASQRQARKHVRRRCAFAHTTLDGHQISGEERFTVEWRKDDDTVWYEVCTVSRPASLLSTLARPLLRFYQREFVAQSIETMKNAIKKSVEVP